ncbi:hypothetical protein AGMMS49982_01610 [Bacteroidia bacterium]|nr:hypothetical protein AGMMS49982_01610 [Bacteroidia bacterium]
MEKCSFSKKNAGKGVVLFVSLIVVYSCALYLSSIIPSKRIQENIKTSALIMEDGFISNPIYFDRAIYGHRLGAAGLDNGTDALMMNNIYNIDNEHPLKSALTNKMTGKVVGEGGISDLCATVRGEATASFNYSRYWHGYIAVWRPLFVFLDYLDLRKINVFVFNLLVFLLVILTARKFGGFAASALALSLMYVNWFCIPLIFQYIVCFYIAFICSLLILIRNFSKESSYMKILFIAGSLTSFIDFLTAPMVTLGIPLIFIVMKHTKFINTLSFKQILFFLSKLVVCWGLGYALTWGMKPMVAAAFGIDIFQNFAEGLSNRINGAEDFGIYSHIYGNNIGFAGMRFISLAHNVYRLVIELYLGPTICIVVALLTGWFIFRKKSKLSPVFYAYLLIAMLPYLWYLMAANHSAVHSTFTYRAQMISVFALLLAYGESIDWVAIKKKIVPLSPL